MRAVIGVILVCLIAGAATGAERVALVLGNARYAAVPDLANPPNDARAIARALRSVGFDVTQIEDAGFDRLRRALARFGDRAARADVAVIYFAGHGVEVARQNYLIPVDAALADTHDLPFEAVRLGLLRRAAERASRLSLVIVDACRNNPFLARMQGENRSLSRGLARVREGGDNELVAFAAREGTVAADGAGETSPYAAALAEALVEPGLEIGKVFRRVRDRVRALTGGAQEPALYGSLSERNFYFLPPETPAPDAAAPPRETPAPTPPATGRMIDLTFWQSIVESEDPRDFEEYLRRFPEGVFAGLARRRLDGLREPGSEETVPTEDSATTARAKPKAGTDTEATPDRSEPDFRPTRQQVREAQARLNILGHDAGPVDGVYGPRTARAISAYEASADVARTGRLSGALLSMLETDVPVAKVRAFLREAEERRAEQRRTDGQSTVSEKKNYKWKKTENFRLINTITNLYSRPRSSSNILDKIYGRSLDAKIIDKNVNSWGWLKVNYKGKIGYIDDDDYTR